MRGATSDIYERLVNGVREYAIYALDPDGNVVNWNPGAERAKGYRADEIVGRHFSKFYTAEDRRRGKPARALETARRTGQFEADGWRVRKNGERFWAHVVIDPILDDAGALIGFAKITRDMTHEKEHADAMLAMLSEQKKLALALEEAASAALAADAAKSAFLATMSHEIRTPLNGILGMTQLMARDPLPSSQRERLEVIQTSGKALLVILNDILDLSKIEAGMLEVETVPFDLAEVSRGVVEILRPLAADKGLSLAIDIAPACEGRFLGDPVRVRQILSNLAGNAIKFTGHGGVRVVLAETATGVRIDVADSGVGLSKAELAGLFRKFAQADASTTRLHGGTGLGLAISRELARAMGGDVDVTSKLGKGSIFSILLPLERVLSLHDPAASDALEGVDLTPCMDLERLRILAAEDNPVNVQVLTAILSYLGADATFVDDGVAAVEAWRTGDFDLVLMDMHMPRMDGVEAARAIRALERSTGRPRTPIVALTADAMTHRLADYRDAGMDDFVAKPIVVNELVQALDRIADVLERSAASAA